MIPWLNLCGWLLCVPYSSIPLFWLMIHPHADYWRSRKHSPYRILLPLWIATWIILGCITFRWHTRVLYSARWGWLPALLLFAVGIWLYSKSRANFTPAQLGGFAELRPNQHDQRLATKGIRARVRHPVYLAHLCEMLAWSLGTGLAVCYGLTAFAVLTGAVMIRMEDAELEKRFGIAYREYKERVPAIFPAP